MPYMQFILGTYFKQKTVNHLSRGLWIFLIFSIITQILFPHALLAEEPVLPEVKKLEKHILLAARRGMAETVDRKKIVNPKVVKADVVMATAYSSTPEETDSSPFITANGMYVYDGLVAANFLPFGTKVRFPEMFGDKIFTVNDRMNRRYSYRIDIWMTSREKALQFGVRKIRFEVVQ